jgi:hypothetical protein
MTTKPRDAWGRGSTTKFVNWVEPIGDEGKGDSSGEAEQDRVFSCRLGEDEAVEGWLGQDCSSGFMSIDGLAPRFCGATRFDRYTKGEGFQERHVLDE